LIVACGGDGTINEVASGILESGADAELGILPSGTGGDFRRTLEISNNAADAARTLRTGRTRRIDIGRVAFTDQRGEQSSRYFIGVASFGISGEVIRRVKTMLRRRTRLRLRLIGSAAKFLSLWRRSARRLRSPQRTWIKIDEEPERRFTVANFASPTHATSAAA
jgi:diacylglycerol kinase family enzyme